jgi:hypothetical protein
MGYLVLALLASVPLAAVFVIIAGIGGNKASTRAARRRGTAGSDPSRG